MALSFLASPSPQVRLNGTNITLANKSPDQLYQDLKNALFKKNKSAFYNFLVPEAEAGLPLIALFAGGALFGFVAGDQYSACQGYEKVTFSSCVFLSNQEVLKSLLPSRGDLVDFTCENGKLISSKKISGEGILPIEYKYFYHPNSMVPARINEIFFDNLFECSGSFDKNGLSLGLSNGENLLCEINKGLHFDYLGPYPHERLIECCGDQACIDAMQSHIKELNGDPNSTEQTEQPGSV